MEAMKNDFKAMQHDYKKACELADMKSAEATDVIDKLESSQKQWRELQQRLSRTEAALGEKETSVTLIMREKDELLKEKQHKEDEAGRKKRVKKTISDKCSSTVFSASWSSKLKFV